MQHIENTVGYLVGIFLVVNGYYGRHVCSLNWASSQRPLAWKVPIANYDHELKGILQEVCDDLTRQGVLKIPQDHGIKV